jgi:hypothetical protein
MDQTYLFVRKVGIKGTTLLAMTRKEAIQLIRRHRKTDFQIGILGGANIQSIQRVYGEYAPFTKVDTVDQLLEVIKE